MVRRLSNQPSLTLPARETFYSFAEADFQSFNNLVSEFLHEEFSKSQDVPFLAMLHDLWTNAANVNIVGITVIFVSSKWKLVMLSLLAAPNSGGHAAGTVAEFIKQKIQTRYDFDIEAYSRFTVSDTTGSARNVADYFDNTDQADCLMYLLSLCLLYALGLKENTRQAGALVVTPGGAFSKSLLVIKRLRDLATFFNSPARLAKLKQIKALYSLPRVNIEIDANTRVGYAATLLRRSVFNYFAFVKYFETAPPSEQATWLKFSEDDWTLIVEMEAISEPIQSGTSSKARRVELLCSAVP